MFTDKDAATYVEHRSAVAQPRLSSTRAAAIRELLTQYLSMANVVIDEVSTSAYDNISPENWDTPTEFSVK